jgi:hypothetical protein
MTAVFPPSGPNKSSLFLKYVREQCDPSIYSLKIGAEGGI